MESNINLWFQKYNYYKFFQFFSSIISIKNVIIIIIILKYFNLLSKQNIQMLLYGLFIIFFFKILFQRKRPFVNNKNIKNLDKNYLDSYSFPSGHAFISIFIAIVLFKKFSNYFIKYCFISIAFFISISRIYLGVHYTSDIIFSLLLVYFLSNTSSIK